MPFPRRRINGISIRYVQIGTDITTPGVGGVARGSLMLKPWMKGSSGSIASGQKTTFGLTATPAVYGQNISDWPRSVGASHDVVSTSSSITLAGQNTTVTVANFPTDVTATSSSIVIASQDAAVVALSTIAVSATSASIGITAYDVLATFSEPANTWFNGQWWPVPTFGVDKWWGVGYAAQVEVTSGVLDFASFDATAKANVDKHITATSGSISLEKQNASVFAGETANITATASSISLAAQDALIQANEDTNVTADTGSISIAAQEAVSRAEKNVSASSSDILLAPLDASVGASLSNTNVVAESGSIVINAVPVSVTAGSTRRINGSTPLIIATNYQSKTMYCSPASGWFTID